MSPFDPYLSRVKAGEITPVSCEKVRRGDGYSIYAYRVIRVVFSDGTYFSTSMWMNPESPKTIRRVEEAFGIKLGENRTKQKEHGNERQL